MENKTSEGELSKYLIFLVGKKYFGIELEKCKAISKNIHVISIPNAKNYLCGIVNIRSELITVFSLSILLNYKSVDEGKHIVRLKTQESNEAFLVDKIIDAVKLKHENFEYAKKHLSGNEAKYIKYVTVYDGMFVLLLNVNKIFEDLGYENKSNYCR